MARPLGKPRENQIRNLTPKERQIINTDKTLIVSGTKEGFDVYGGDGKIYPLSEIQRAKLGFYWGIRPAFPWETEAGVLS